MAFSFFKPKSATEKNYREYERELYIALETLKKICQMGESDKKYYILTSTHPAYKKAFKLSYSLVRFYTKHREESKEFMFKRNFLLSKTRGIFSEQKKETGKLTEDYYFSIEKLDELPTLYFKMFKLNKSFNEELPEELDNDKQKD